MEETQAYIVEWQRYGEYTQQRIVVMSAAQVRSLEISARRSGMFRTLTCKPVSVIPRERDVPSLRMAMGFRGK